MCGTRYTVSRSLATIVGSWYYAVSTFAPTKTMCVAEMGSTSYCGGKVRHRIVEVAVELDKSDTICCDCGCGGGAPSHHAMLCTALLSLTGTQPVLMTSAAAGGFALSASGAAAERRCRALPDARMGVLDYACLLGA
jgi:hypothetical protein